MKANMYYIQIFESDSIFLGLAYLLLGVIHKLREQVRGEGGVSKMFTLLYNPYLVNWFTRGEGGVKTGQNLVHVVCERPQIARHNII